MLPVLFRRSIMERAPEQMSLLRICDNVDEDTVPLLRDIYPDSNKYGPFLFTTRYANVAKALLYFLICPSLKESLI